MDSINNISYIAANNVNGSDNFLKSEVIINLYEIYPCLWYSYKCKCFFLPVCAYVSMCVSKVCTNVFRVNRKHTTICLLVCELNSIIRKTKNEKRASNQIKIEQFYSRAVH